MKFLVFMSLLSLNLAFQNCSGFKSQLASNSAVGASEEIQKDPTTPDIPVQTGIEFFSCAMGEGTASYGDGAICYENHFDNKPNFSQAYINSYKQDWCPSRVGTFSTSACDRSKAVSYCVVTYSGDSSKQFNVYYNATGAKSAAFGCDPSNNDEDFLYSYFELQNGQSVRVR